MFVYRAKYEIDTLTSYTKSFLLLEKIADFLEYATAKKKEIEERQRGDPSKCCTELMEDWLNNDRGVAPKTWHKLVSVLKEIKELSSEVYSIERSLLKEGLL